MLSQVLSSLPTTSQRHEGTTNAYHKNAQQVHAQHYVGHGCAVHPAAVVQCWSSVRPKDIYVARLQQS
jgi:hypothetical protein